MCAPHTLDRREREREREGEREKEFNERVIVIETEDRVIYSSVPPIIDGVALPWNAYTVVIRGFD